MGPPGEGHRPDSVGLSAGDCTSPEPRPEGAGAKAGSDFWGIQGGFGLRDGGLFTGSLSRQESDVSTKNCQRSPGFWMCLCSAPLSEAPHLGLAGLGVEAAGGRGDLAPEAGLGCWPALGEVDDDFPACLPVECLPGKGSRKGVGWGCFSRRLQAPSSPPPGAGGAPTCWAKLLAPRPAGWFWPQVGSPRPPAAAFTGEG